MSKLSVKLALLFILAYSLLYLFYFWQTPLGQMPVLDGTENFRLAEQIASGTLPNEPFFRSMLYPAILSVFCKLGFYDELFCIASIIGILSHLISSILVFLLVSNIWNNQNAATISCLLYGLYPPAVFFAAEPLDTTISITFMLGSLYFFFIGMDKKQKKYLLISGLSMGICCLLRSNLLPFAIIFLSYPVIQLKKDWKSKTLIYSLISFIAFSLMMLTGGILCYMHSGDFRLLPWQGAASFYPANSLRANGKFYQHTVYIPNRKVGDNPARLEAEYIYSKETGNNPPFNLNDYNHFWLKKSFAEIASNPTHWIGLMIKKIYYLFNNFEQYNNKTFSFHKSICPILNYNPICFGILVVLFFLGFVKMLPLFRKANQENEELFSLQLIKITTLFTGILTLSMGIIAFYVSSRFRLPLVSLIIVFSSYIFCFDIKKLINWQNFIIILIAGFLTFSSFFNAADISTYKEDRLLNAFACSRLGLDEEQILWANRVLEEDSHNLQAIRLKIVGFTNLALFGKLSDSDEWKSVENEMKYLSKYNLYFDDTIFLSGCYACKFEKNKEKALLLWTNGGAESMQPELFQACLIYTGLIESNESDKKMASYNPLLAASISKQNEENNNNNTSEIKNSLNILKFLLD